MYYYTPSTDDPRGSPMSNLSPRNEPPQDSRSDDDDDDSAPPNNMQKAENFPVTLSGASIAQAAYVVHT